MDITKTLKLTHVTYGEFNFPAIRLNIPVCEVFRAIGATGSDFYEKLEDLGFPIDAPIMASQQDVSEYLNIPQSDDPLGINHDIRDYEEQLNGLLNILQNLIYYDEPFIDEATGLCGLKDSNGKIVVPARFAECRGSRDMTEADSLAIVTKPDGGVFLTPRNGRGYLVNTNSYTALSYSSCYGWVRRNDKVGLIDIKTGDPIIPCSMDWLESSFTGLEYIFGSAGKIGFYDTVLRSYSRPKYSAYDFSTYRFCRDGEWGWVKRKGNRFVTNTPRSFFDVQCLGIDITSFLNHDDKPKDKNEKEYYTGEEMFASIEEKGLELQKELSRPFSEIIKLPALSFPEDLESCPGVTEAITGLVSDESAVPQSVRLEFSIKNPDAPLMNVTVSADGDKVIVEWSPRSHALAWLDTDFPLLCSCNQLMEYGKDTYRFRFVKEFEINRIAEIAKFITFYFRHTWHDSSPTATKRD